MPLRFLGVISIASCFVCAGCAGQFHASKWVSKCAVGEVCAVDGKLVANEGKGRIEGPRNETDTDCITVALPPELDGEYDAVPVRASGAVTEMPVIPGASEVTIRDRWVDAEACYSGLVMYVDEIALLH